VIAALVIVYVAVFLTAAFALFLQSRLVMRVRRLFRDAPLVFHRLEIPDGVDLGRVVQNPRRFYFVLALLGTALRVVMAATFLLALGTAWPSVPAGLGALGAVAAVSAPHLVAKLAIPPRGAMSRFTAESMRIIGRVLSLYPRQESAPADLDPTALAGAIVTSPDGHEVFDANQKRLLAGLLSLKRVGAGEIMTPLADAAVVDREWSVARAAEEVKDRGHPRIPVVAGDRTNVVGLVLTKDIAVRLHSGQADDPVERITRPARRVSDKTTLARLLREFQVERVHLGIVRDARGRSVGLITLDDILRAALRRGVPER
jgi:CBS domain containing-hemolysin-like protein